ncbi:MAG TPA: tetratricopeptide repeat protein [Bryobacteraceae bacterium]|nr:tetratricopeptide repeat protein [Bryobacteraceae bacterium]
MLLVLLASCSRDPKVQAQNSVNSGNKFFDRGKYKEAAIMYKKALSKDQRFGEAYYRLALTDLKLGSLGEAVGMFRRAVELQPDNMDAAVQLANIYLFASTQDQKNGPELIEEGATLVEKILTKDPNSYDGHRLAGQIALLKKDPKTAIKELETSNRIKPYQNEVALAYFEALVRDNQEEAAEKMARDFISKEKTFAPIYDRLYIQYMIAKRMGEADAILKLKVENNPKSPNYLLELAAHYAITNRRPDMEAVLQRLTDEKQFPNGHLLAGDFYLIRLRETEPAKKQYEAGMAAVPKDKLVYQKRLVELYAGTGSNVEANKLVAAILKENPKDADGIAMRAALMLTSGDAAQINQAAVDLQSLVAKDPNNHLLKLNYAKALLAQLILDQRDPNKHDRSKLEQARLQLEDAIKVRPDFVAGRELLLRVYMAKPDLPKALQASEDLLQMDRNNLTGHLTRSAALLAMGSNAKAREELDTITKLYPQNPDARYQIGVMAWQDKDYKKAEQVFVALNHDNPRDPRGLFGITETLAAQNRMNDAIKEMDKAIAAEPERTDLVLGRANFYVRAQRYDEAIAAYKKLLEKEPGSADLLFRLGEAYARKGDINLAAETFRKDIQAAPNNTLPLLRLGLILETTGPPEQAKAVYEQILKIDPNHAVALNNLAFRKAEEGTDLDSALAMAQKARQISPNATAMADTVGWIYIKKNQSADAERIFKDLVVKEPANYQFHYHYGMALSQKGDKASARRELQIALKSNPSKDDAKKIQDMLSQL